MESGLSLALLGLILLSGGMLLWLFQFLWLRAGTSGGYFPPLERLQSRQSMEEADITIVSSRVISRVNRAARSYIGDAATLEQAAQTAYPPDGFLQLAAGEGRSILRINGCLVDARSERLAGGKVVRIRWVPIRPRATEPIPFQKSQMDFSRQAFQDLDLAATAGQLADGLRDSSNADWVSLTLWDPERRMLVPAASSAGMRIPESAALPSEGVPVQEASGRQAALTCAPSLTADPPGTDTEPVRRGPAGLFRSHMAFPLLTNGELLGVAEFFASTPGRFSDADLIRLQPFIDVASLAVKNSLFYGEQLRRTAEANTLADISKAAGNLTDRAGFLHQAADVIQRNIGADAAGFILHNLAAGRLEPHSSFRGLTEQALGYFRIGLPPSTRARSRWFGTDPMHADGSDVDFLFRELQLSGLLRSHAFRHVRLSPLGEPELHLGWLMLARNYGPGWSAGDRLRIDSLATHCGNLLAGFVRLSASEQKIHMAESMRRIAVSAASPVAPEETIRTILGDTAAILQAERLAVLLLDDASGENRCETGFCVGVSPEDLTGLAMPSAEDPSFGASATSSREPLRIHRLLHGPDLPPFYLAWLDTFQCESLIAAPLLISGNSAGELLVSTSRMAYDEPEMEYLAAVAAQLSGILERSRLTATTDENLRRRIDQLTFLTRLSREINTSTDLVRLLRMVHEESIRITGADAGRVAMLDPNQPAGPLRPLLLVGETASSSGFSRLEQSVLAEGKLHIVRRAAAQKHSLPVGMRSAILTPILFQQKTVGMIHLQSRQPDWFDDISQEFIQTLALQVAIAVGNAQQTEEQAQTGDSLRRKKRLLHAIHENNRRILAADSLREVLSHTADTVQSALGLSPVVVGRNEGGQMVWEASAGLPLGVWNLLPQEYYPAAMIDRLSNESGQGSIAQFDACKDPDFKRLAASFGIENEGHTLLMAPLQTNDGARIGAIVTTSAVGSAPAQDLLESLEILAAQASFAIQHSVSRTEDSAATGTVAPVIAPLSNASQVQDLQLRLSRLRILAEITEAISEPSEPQALLQALAEKIRETFQLDQVLLVEESSSGPQVILSAGATPDDLQLDMLLGQNNPVLAVFQRGIPILARSMDELPIWKTSPLLSALKTRSFLCFPIRTRQKVIAAALLISRRVSTPFLPGDPEIFLLLGEQTATFLENARLLEVTRRRLREGNVLLEFSHQISTLDLPLILQTLVDRIRNALPEAEGAMTALWDKSAAMLTVRAVSGYSNPHRLAAIRCQKGEGPLGSVLAANSVVRWPKVDMAADYNLGAENLELYRNGAGGLVPLSAMGVPLQVGERVLGVLLAENFTNADAFTKGSEEVMYSLANQAALALEKARLFQEMMDRTRELDERATHLALLNRLTSAAISTSSERTLLQTACRELAGAFDVPQTTAALLDEDRTHALISAEYLYPGRPSSVGSRIPVQGVEPIAAVLQTRAPLQVENAATDPRMEPLHAWLAQRQTTSILLIPVVVAGEVTVLILVESPEPHPFSLTNLALAQTVSAQLSQALENVRLHQSARSHATDLEQRVVERTTAMEREHARAEALLRISTELVASLDLEHVLNRALRLVNETIGADQAAIVLNDPETQQLVLRAALEKSGAPPTGGRSLPFRVGEGLAGWVIQQRQPVILPDISQDPRWVNLYPGEPPRYRSALAVPLMVGADALGALLLLSDNPSVFNPEQLTLVSAAANQVAAAINNAELYRLIRDQAERLGGLVRTQQVEARKSRAMLEAIADGVMVTDTDHFIVLYNDAAERVLGLDRTHTLNRPVGEYVGVFGKAGRSWLQALHRWKQTPSDIPGGEFLAERLTLENKKVLSVHLSPISSGEEYLGAVAVFRDITQDVEVDRLKSEFVATVSHELRTPMTAIRGYVEIMLMGASGDLSDSQRQFLQVVKENTVRLEDLVNDLLDVSRIESGQIRLNLDVVEISHLIHQLAESLRDRCRQSGKQMDVQVDLCGDIPAIHVDRQRVAEIIGNLMENSYLYTPEGGKILLRAKNAQDGVQIDVEDNGIGIPPSDQARIFERFFRGEHPLVMASSGTGLGLSITQHLVEMHGGKIWMESEGEPGKGSTFHIWLPRESVQSA